MTEPFTKQNNLSEIVVYGALVLHHSSHDRYGDIYSHAGAPVLDLMCAALDFWKDLTNCLPSGSVEV